MSLTNTIFSLVASPFLAFTIVLLCYKYFLRLGYYVQREEFKLELDKKDLEVRQLTADLRKKEAYFFLKEAEFLMKESAFREKEKEFETTYVAMEKVISIQESTIEHIRRKISGEDDEDLNKLFKL